MKLALNQHYAIAIIATRRDKLVIDVCNADDEAAGFADARLGMSVTIKRALS